MSVLDDLSPELAAEVADVFASLSPIEQAQTLRMLRVREHEVSWRATARPAQLAPAGDWLVWLILAGRGFGKTRSAAEEVARLMRRYPGCRVALVAPTFSAGRDDMVEGESGLLACFDPSELRGGNVDKGWNRSLGEVYLSNGSRAKIYTSERPRQLRGPQFHFAWGDEVAQWDDAHKGTSKDTTWSNLNIATRLRAADDWPADYRPRIIVTTTPRPVALIKGKAETVGAMTVVPNKGLLDLPHVHVTRGSTFDNLANLAETYRATVVEPLIGTRLGRQELNAELLLDVEGALFPLELLSRRRWPDASPQYVRTVVSVDPSGSADGDATGIVGVSKTVDGMGVVRADRSRKGTPIERYGAAVDLAFELGAGEIVYEGNYGGDNVRAALEAVIADRQRAHAELRRVAVEQGTDDPGPLLVPRLLPVSAKGSKADRATSIVPLYETGRVWHEPGLAALEDEMSTWTPADKWSPNRLDAVVHGVRHLVDPQGPRNSGVRSAAGTTLPGGGARSAR